jgi:hypothetical protein
VPRLYVRNWANQIDATIWFRFEGPGWRYGGLLDAQQSPKPAYDAYRFLAQELSNARYAGPVTYYTDLEGYAFIKASKRVWVLWPPQNSTRTIGLPAGVTRVYDVLGQEITPQDTDLAISSPVYLEFAR